jgi:hypothetical protein
MNSISIQDRSCTRARTSILVAWLILLSMTVGCSSFMEKKTDWVPFLNKQPAITIPERVMPIWTDTVLHQPGLPGVRGFGGRVYFYEEGNQEPVQIEGRLTVYVFDGDLLSHPKTSPEKKYIITAQQMAELGSKSSLGFSYNIWIPWDEVGGMKRELSLVTRYDGTAGGTVIADLSTHLLPGAKEVNPESFPVRQAGGSIPVVPTLDSQTNSTNNTEIFSIDLPRSFDRRAHLTPNRSPDADKQPTYQLNSTSTSGNIQSEMSALLSASTQWKDSIQDVSTLSRRRGSVNPNADINGSGGSSDAWEEPNLDDSISDYFEPNQFPARTEAKSQPGPVPWRTLPRRE